jgi:hypothetical protein
MNKEKRGERNICYRWFVLRKMISQSNPASTVKSEMREAMKSLFRVKYINDVCFSRIWWDDSDVIKVSHLKKNIFFSYRDSCLIINIITWKNQREHVQIIDKNIYKLESIYEMNGCIKETGNSTTYNIEAIPR